MERVKVNNDPAASYQMGGRHCSDGDYDKGVEYLNKAAELGDAGAHYNLGNMYYYGQGVEKDEEKGISHLERAATVGGHPHARYILAGIEGEKW
jgi:TPR repeat protein